MRTLGFLLQKEFRQIFRNKALLPLIFVMPIIQLVIIPLAANYEVRNIKIAIVDHDHSSWSEQLTQKILSSGYFSLASATTSYAEAFSNVEKDEADLILEIPEDFERNLVRENHEKVFIAVNAINGIKAGLGASYLNNIIQKFNNDIRLDWGNQVNANQGSIRVETINWFNEHLNYKYFMVPGILVFLVTMVGSYLCALNIVKEKEIGTIEQINVTPVSKFNFILGKLIPFWVIGIFIFSVGLFVVGRVVYGIVPEGSLVTLYAFLGLYLVAMLGLGLLISTYSETQQQAMSVAFFFMMIFLLMSGLFTSIESMPQWAKTIAQLNPVTHFIEVTRMIILKGSTFYDIRNQFMIMGGFALFFNTWAILNFRKTN